MVGAQRAEALDVCVGVMNVSKAVSGSWNLLFHVSGKASPKLTVFPVLEFVTSEPVTRQYAGLLSVAGTSNAPVGTTGRLGFRSLIGPIVIPEGAANCTPSAMQSEVTALVGIADRKLSTTATAIAAKVIV